MAALDPWRQSINIAQNVRRGVDLCVVCAKGSYTPGRSNEGLLNLVIRAVEAMRDNGCLSYEIHLSRENGVKHEWWCLAQWTSDEAYRQNLTSPRVQEQMEQLVCQESTSPLAPGVDFSLWKMKRWSDGSSSGPESFAKRTYKAFAVYMTTRSQPGRDEEYGNLLFKGEQYARMEPGCILYDLHVGRDDSNVHSFFVYAVFRSASDYGHHISQQYCMLNDSCLYLTSGMPEVSTWKRVDFPI
jgi:quinol monooxygenase YgiN